MIVNTLCVKKKECLINHNADIYSVELCLANSYGKYVGDDLDNINFHSFLIYLNGSIGGVCDLKKKNLWNDATSRT